MIVCRSSYLNRRLAVAKTMLKNEFHGESATVEEAVAKAEKAVEKMAAQLVLPGPGAEESQAAPGQAGGQGDLLPQPP